MKLSSILLCLLAAVRATIPDADLFAIVFDTETHDWQVSSNAGVLILKTEVQFKVELSNWDGSSTIAKETVSESPI